MTAADRGLSGTFDAEQGDALADADQDHWWFRSKAAFIGALARRELTTPPGESRYADVGAGSGGVTVRLAEVLGAPCIVEGSLDLAATAHRRHGIPAVAAATAATSLRDASVDVVSLLDVIEHLPDPVPTLIEARRVLRPGGLLVVSVPAHPRLWSEADELLGHQRRYTRRAAREHVRAAGFELLRCTHFFSYLTVPVWLTRRTATAPEAQLGLDQRSGVVSGIARMLTACEIGAARVVSLPFGTSILCLARRPA